MNTQSELLDQLRDYYETNQESIVNDLKTFLRFESVSAEPDRKDQVQACAEWLRSYLTNIPLTVELWKTDFHPVLYAHDLTAGPDKPTLLIYNHYDVQPVDPVDLWDSPPFVPTIKENEIYARGAQDNKGQCFYVIQAIKALKKCFGHLPVNLKLIIEGDEETGSPSLPPLLKQKAEELKADYLFIVDVGIKNATSPSVTVGLRGIVALEVTCKGSETDLHSGCHGGLAYNPIHALVEILAKLRNDKGIINVPGFYDNIKECSAEQKNAFSFDFDEQEYIREFGCQPTGGERSLPPLERNWLRPTVEVNGITGGFSGPGVKTVIPAIASAKLSCRLVCGQDPQATAKKVAEYLEKQAPPGITVTTHIHPGGGKAIMTDPYSKAAKAVAQAFTEVFQSPCKYILEGASIPIVADLQELCNGKVVLLGLGLPGDRIHAPNEHFGLDRLQQGFLIIARSLELLGGSTK